MRTVNRGQRESPTRFNTDLYIIRHSKNHNQLINENGNEKIAHSIKQTFQPNSKIIVSNNNKTAQSQAQKNNLPQQDHRRNIDRLMGVLKEKSAGKILKDKAVRNIFRWILKRLQNKSWLKGYTFNKIKYINTNLTRPENEIIPKKSYTVDWKTDTNKKSPIYVDLKGQNIDLVDTKHIIAKQNGEENTSLNNSLQNNLKQMSNSKESGRTNSQKKLSKDIYILRRHSKGQIHSKQELSTTNELTSYKSLPKIDQISVRPASPLSSRSAKGLLTLPQLYLQSKIDTTGHFYQDRTPSFSIQSMKQVLQQNSPEHSSNEHSLIRQINMAKNVQITKIQRKNRLMQNILNEVPSVQKRQINNEQNRFFTKIQNQRQNIQAEQQRIRSYTTGKISFTYSNRTQQSTQHLIQQNLVAKRSQFEKPPTFIKTSTANENYVSQQGNNYLPLGSKASRSKIHISRKRCTSMPAVVFVYKSKQQMAKANPVAASRQIGKGSPILQLNDMMQIVNRQSTTQDDPYLTNNVSIPNNNQSRHHRKVQYRDTNNYNIPSIHQVQKNNRINQILNHPHHNQNPILNHKGQSHQVNTPTNQTTTFHIPPTANTSNIIQHTINHLLNQKNIPNNVVVTQHIPPNPYQNPIIQPIVQQNTVNRSRPQKLETIRPTQYYGVIPQHKKKVIIPQPKPQNTAVNRNRLKSLNTYILRKDSPIKLAPGIIPVSERDRARSLNPKIEVTLKKCPMINVY